MTETKTIQQGPYGTEVDIKVVTVTLGKRQFQIEEAPLLRTMAWREDFVEAVLPMLKMLEGQREVEFSSLADVLGLLPLLEAVIRKAPREVVRLFFEYAPYLEEDREYIEEESRERQLWAAFQEVVLLAIPFETGRMVARAPGLMEVMTSSNSPSANGDTPSKTPKD